MDPPEKHVGRLHIALADAKSHVHVVLQGRRRSCIWSRRRAKAHSGGPQRDLHVRTEEEDPDPETEEDQDEPPDPVRLVEGLTLPKDVVDRMRQMAKASRLHIYVHPAA